MTTDRSTETGHVGGDEAAELRALVETRAAAVADRDADTLEASLAEDVEQFGVLPPARITGRDQVVAGMRAWFDSYDGPIDYQIHDLHAAASGDVGYCSYRYRVQGTLKSGDDVDMWVRATLGARRRDGRWVVVHDHESVPWDPETGQGVLTDD